MLGNLAFDRPDVAFVGHAKLPRAMAMVGGIYLQRAEARAGEPLGSEHIVLPERLVEGELDLDLGARVLRLTAHPSAHTDHDLSVYDPKTGTLWLGDLLFIEHVPVIDASINGWIAVLEDLQGVPATRAVPGHGPPQVTWPDAAADELRYLTRLRAEVRKWIARGGDLRTAQEEVGYTEATKWRLFTSYHKRNVSAAFTELEWEE